MPRKAVFALGVEGSIGGEDWKSEASNKCCQQGAGGKAKAKLSCLIVDFHHRELGGIGEVTARRMPGVTDLSEDIGEECIVFGNDCSSSLGHLSWLRQVATALFELCANSAKGLDFGDDRVSLQLVDCGPEGRFGCKEVHNDVHEFVRKMTQLDVRKVIFSQFAPRQAIVRQNNICSCLQNNQTKPSNISLVSLRTRL